MTNYQPSEFKREFEKLWDETHKAAYTADRLVELLATETMAAPENDQRVHKLLDLINASLNTATAARRRASFARLAELQGVKQP